MVFADTRGVVPPRRRKILYCGIDAPMVGLAGSKPRTESLSNQADRLRTLPVDGVLVQVIDEKQFPMWPQTVVGNNLFSGVRYDDRTLAPAAEQLRVLKKTPQLTDNFLAIAPNYWFETGAKNKLGLFDDARWSAILDSVAAYARMARSSGVIRGMIFDIEPYHGPGTPASGPEWAYSFLASTLQFNEIDKGNRGKDPAGAYRDQARKRGHQFCEAIQKNLPNSPILMYLGVAMATLNNDPGRSDLMPPFVDGMLEQLDARKSGGYLIDGWEGAYKYRTEAEYRSARDIIQQKNKSLSTVPKLYEKYVRVGFGKWLDAGEASGNQWNEADAGKNFYKPSDWEQTLRLALQNTDEYVWIWSGGSGRLFPMSFGRKANVPGTYSDALRAAKKGL